MKSILRVFASYGCSIYPNQGLWKGPKFSEVLIKHTII